MVLGNKNLRNPVIDTDRRILEGIVRPITLPYLFITLILGVLAGYGETTMGSYPIEYLPLNVLGFTIAAGLLLYIPAGAYYAIIDSRRESQPSTNQGKSTSEGKTVSPVFLPGQRHISRRRLWISRLLLLVIGFVAVGIQATTSPTRFMNVEATPLLTTGLVVGVLLSYPALLMVMSSKGPAPNT